MRLRMKNERAHFELASCALLLLNIAMHLETCMYFHCFTMLQLYFFVYEHVHFRNKNKYRGKGGNRSRTVLIKY